MEAFEGWCYAADGPQRVAVRASVDAAGELFIEQVAQAPWSKVGVSDRVGNIPRRLTLPDGRVLETADNDAIDRIEARLRPGHGSALLHRLERGWPLAVVAVAFMLGFGWWSAVHGVPLFARWVAFRLPADVLATTSSQTLATLDRWVFKPSALEPERRAELGRLFARAGAAAGDSARFQLALRNGGAMRANAFALPDGTIVVTDQLVKLAETDEQILAVVAHEIGHVEARHGVQRLAQSAALGTALILVTGDVSQVLTVASALPGMLLESAYSRDFEREADARAVELLNAMGVPPSNLAHMLQRLQENHGREAGPSWLSSHPSTPERAQAIWNRAKP